jgi:glycosyltransferase involved in cell wall biosynthesis
MKEIPTFLEINSNDVTEYKVSYSRLINIYHTVTREFVLKNAVGFFFLTPEITKNYLKYKKPYTTIGDSIDFARYPICDAPCNETPSLVFMGVGISPWFGIDKVILIAKHFPNWKFDIIGAFKSEFTEELPKNIVAHGRLSQKEYEKILLRSDIGIGTLALYRINMNETTPLKVREYLAYGLPTIIGYKDPDLPEPLPFILSLPNSESNVRDKLDDIKTFVEAWKGKRVPRSQISHLSLDVKENQRLEFIMRHSRSIHPK